MRSPLQPVFQHWLKLQCQMTNNSPQGLLVQYQEESKPRVEARVSLKSTVLPVVMDDRHMIEAARQVLEKQRLYLLKTEEQAVFLGYPVVMDNKFWGAVVVQVEENNATVMHSVIKLLKWGTTWLQFVIHAKTNQLIENTAFVEGDPNQILSLMITTLKERSLTEAAISTVNFIASQFKLERVSIGLRYSKRVALEGVSFSASFDAKSESLKLIIGAMDEAVEQKSDISIGLNRDSNDGNVTRAHEDTIKKHHLTSIHTFLLRAQDDVVGAITLENTNGDDLPESVRQFMENSLGLLAAVFHIKRASNKGVGRLIKENVFYWLAKVFGSGHPYAKTFAVTGAFLLVSFFIPAGFNISNDAVLESVDKHLLVSPYDGFIKEIYVQPGDLVDQGQVLGELKDEDLSLEQRRLKGQLHQYRIEYDNSLANGSRVQAAILEAQISQAQVDLDLIEQKLRRVRLESPITGVIVSDDMSQSKGAPVNQGEVLFEVANSDQYKVSIYVDERNIIYFRKGQQGKLSLTSLPEHRLDVIVTRITPISEVKNSRNYFRVDAEIAQLQDFTELLSLRPGMSGSAKVYVDQRPLAWIWFHDLWYWLRLVLWI